VRASSQVVVSRSPLSAILPVLAGMLVRCGAPIQDDLDVPVVLKALDEEVVQLPVLPRHDEQVPGSCQEDLNHRDTAIPQVVSPWDGLW
jgi:hypothetical protein